MNDIFNMRRFGAFVLKWYKEVSIFSMLIWVLFFILVHLRSFFWALGNTVSSMEELRQAVDEITKEYSMVYVACLMLIIWVLTLRTSWKLFRVKSKSYWLLPISKLEKLLFVILNSVILPTIIYTFFFWTVHMVNDYKFVTWQTADISIEDVEKEYGDVDTFTDYSGVVSYRIDPKIAFTDLFISNAWNSKVPVIKDNTIEKATITNGVTERKAWDGIWDTFWISFLGFSVILWVGVSPYKKSLTVAIITHTVFILAVCASIIIFVVMPIFSIHSQGQSAYVYHDGWGFIYLLFQSKQ